MPKKKKRPRGRSPKNTHPRSGVRATREREEPDLIRSVEVALRGAPLDLLALASSYLHAFDLRSRDLSDPGEALDFGVTDLVEHLLEFPSPPTDALLLALAAIMDDEALRLRIRQVVGARTNAVPAGARGIPEWLVRLADAQVYRTVETIEPLGDGENIVVGMRLSGGESITAVVYVDQNMGTIVKDAFVLSESFEAVIAAWDRLDSALDTEVRVLPGADARARITEAIDKGALMYTPIETDSWPACRPLVEWVVSTLPPGGTGYQWAAWNDDRLAALADVFFASEFGAGLDSGENRDRLASLMEFAGAFGTGDPLRWSPVSVEILLSDWIPRKIVAPPDFLALVPSLLRPFIRFAHAERMIPAKLTADTLAAVDRYEPGYQVLIRTPRHQGPMALLERMGMLAEDEPYANFDPDGDYTDLELRELVGEALTALDSKPLPNERFDWSGIPEDMHDRVAEIVTLIDEACDSLLDREYRTAARRFLGDVTRADPAVFRVGKPKNSAAAVLWVIGKANDVFDPFGFSLEVADLLDHFGLSSGVSQRANRMLAALGIRRDLGPEITLGDARYLVAERRAVIMAEFGLSVHE